MRFQRLLPILLTLAGLIGAAHATPISPTRDDEVVEVLPAQSGGRAEARRQRQQLARQPGDVALALTVSKRYLDQAHEQGDPRFAGLAMAAIAHWSDVATMPDDVLLMRAGLQQYLHQFDASAQSLQALLARPGAPRPQAWLTLATVRRVQGRYADSDAACAQVASTGAAVYGEACRAENLALRGEFDRARATFTSLIAAGDQPPAIGSWLATSLAELEQRAGRADASERAFRAALKPGPDAYATLAYADLLIDEKRPAQALALLKGQVRSDAVLLRLAIAGKQVNAPTAQADIAEMRERIALANERPDAKVFHGREQAMFALEVEGDAASALELARGNAAHQREALDLLVLWRAARASGQQGALDEAKRLAAEIGLVDRRVQAPAR